LRTLVVFAGFLIFLSCKTESKKDSSIETTIIENNSHDVFVCPEECENGMMYYLEGKCDICHVNLIKKE